MGHRKLFSSTVITLVKPHVCAHIVFVCLLRGGTLIKMGHRKLCSRSVIIRLIHKVDVCGHIVFVCLVGGGADDHGAYNVVFQYCYHLGQTTCLSPHSVSVSCWGGADPL